MKGSVKTFTEDLDDVEAGSVGILKKNNNILGICTIMHVDNKSGNWMAEVDDGSNVIIDSDHTFCSLIIQDSSNDNVIYPLKFNQWRKSLKANEVDSGKIIEYVTIPVKYYKGTNLKECSNCHAHYYASRNQSLCKDCCDLFATAKIILTKPKQKATVKPKRKRMFSASQVKLIAIEAYKKGSSTNESYDSFERWLNKQL